MTVSSIRSSLRPVALPLATILTVQSLLTSVAYGVSVIAPDAAPEIGLSPDSVGFLASTLYFVAMIAGLGSETVIRRFGPTRTLEWLPAVASLGCLALMASHPVLAFVGAALMGISMGPVNPTGSYVLGRLTPPVWQPLVLSIKQCATPMGGMLAGAVLPTVAVLYDWRLALAILPASGVVIMILAHRGGLEVAPPAAAVPPRRSVLAEVRGSLRDAFATPALRAVVLMGFFLGLCQLGIAAYYVVFLWSQTGMTPVAAGGVFAAFHVSGIITRIVLGSVAERVIPTRYLLPALGILMGAATAAAATFGPESSLLWMYGVTAVLGASGNGWVGLYFAELVRLAPEKTASVAGGAQFVMFVGIFLGPLLYGLILHAGLGHAVSLGIFALLSLGTALIPVLVARRPANLAGA